MNRKTVTLLAPVASRSGYGHHSRDIALAILSASDKYDLSIRQTAWGGTPNTALDEDDPDHQAVRNCIVPSSIQLERPDIFIQVGLPTEFKPGYGKYNIGITAGIETDVCSPDWIEGMNRMERVIVPSEHAATVFRNSVFDKLDKNTHQKTGIVKLSDNVKLDVLFEGVDTDVYFKTSQLDPDIKQTIDDVKESFCFLFVGHWLNGGLGEDRKDVGMLIKTFVECFKNTPPRARPALVLKTSGATFSITDREHIKYKIQVITEGIKNPPTILLVHGDLSDNQMNSLYNHPKIKAMVSFTKGEGFGRPLLEFTTTGKPVITTNWSGHIDFLHKDYTTLLPGELVEVSPAIRNEWFIEGAKWFQVDYSRAYAVLRDIVKNYSKYLKKASLQKKYTLQNFTLEKMNSQLIDILDDVKVAQFQTIKLPKLKIRQQ